MQQNNKAIETTILLNIKDLVVSYIDNSQPS